MKKIIGLLLGVSLMLTSGLLAENYSKAFQELHKEGWSVQIANGIDVGYYTKNHEYVIGISGLTYTDSTVGGTKSTTLKPGVFIRKCHPATDAMTTGYGVSLGTIVGEASGQTIKNAIRGKIYLFVEYALNPNLLVEASFRPIDYETYETGSTKTTNTKYLGGSSVQLAYIF